MPYWIDHNRPAIDGFGSVLCKTLRHFLNGSPAWPRLRANGPDRILFEFCALGAALFLGFFVNLAAAYGQNSQSTLSVVNDIQLGEKNNISRIVLVCEPNCEIEQSATRGTVFLIKNTAANLTIDMSKRSKNINLLKLSPIDDLNVSEFKIPSPSGPAESSLLTVELNKTLSTAIVKECAIEGVPTSCIDFRFKQKSEKDEIIEEKVVSADTYRQEVTLKVPDIAQLGLRNGSQVEQSASANIQIEDPILQPGGLREGNSADQTSHAAVPVRVSLPESLSNRQLSPPSILRPLATQKVLSRVDFREQAETITARRFDSENCLSAQSQLEEDAWALEAMLIIGFCEATKGDFEEAESIFKRLALQQPQNYEIMIGRGLVATINQEISVGRKFFSDALAQDPPRNVIEALEGLLAQNSNFTSRL